MSVAGLRSRLTQLERIPETGTRDAAKRVTEIARDVGARYGPITMGRKRKAYPLTGVARFKGSGHNVQATVWGKPTGPWVWVSTGTRPHAIPRANRRRRIPVMWAAGYEHAVLRTQTDVWPVQHPGVSGRGAWDEVKRRAAIEVPDVYRDRIRQIIGAGSSRG